MRVINLVLCGLLASVSGVSYAAVSATEAQRLNAELTPMGGEKKANAEGTIPEWTGGYKDVDPAYKPGQPRNNPFASDKPRFTITKDNYAQYAKFLSDGQKHMLETMPGFKMNVYPTRRTAAAPSYVYENTYKNATQATLTSDGMGVEKSFGGIPFPIPQSGAEAIWNHLLAFRGIAAREYWSAYVVGSDGVASLASGSLQEHSWPYYDRTGNAENFSGKYYQMVVENKEPAFKAGEIVLAHEFVDGKRSVWQYLPGQRRVRRAPNVAYDTPDFISSGVTNFDEYNLFSGAIDRYEWKLVGKQEMFVPYNNNGFNLKKIDEVLGEKFVNPDATRWELHRVWVVEANLADGKRHAMPKRRFYLDEDKWMALVSDGWDTNGNLWKAGFAFAFVMPEVPAIQTRPLVMYDFTSGAYLAHLVPNERTPQLDNSVSYEDRRFTPDALSSRGVR